MPCTKKNGCASIALEPLDPLATASQLIERLRQIIVPWCPAGSDPGFCVAKAVPPAVVEWGLRCKRELVTQAEARNIAAAHEIHLEGLSGTEDGVIGALAAVGLMAMRNDGRVVHFGSGTEDWYDVTGCLSVDEILSRGVDTVLTASGGEPVVAGTVDIGKRLRPNFHGGRVVLYVARGEATHWEAVRVV